MSTIKSVIGLIQESLENPNFDSLSDARIFRIMIQEGDYVCNELNLSGNPWNFQSFSLTVNAGEDYHMITEVGDFMVPFAVETSDPSNPMFVSRPIRIVDLVDLERYASAGTQTGSTNSSQKHSAMAVAFTEMPGQAGMRAARFGPIPNTTATFTILYQPITTRPSTLQDQLTKFPQFEQYYIIRIEVNALQFCEWPTLSPQDNEAKRVSMLGNENMPGSRAFRFKELDTQFTRQRRKIDQRNNTRVVAPGRILRKI